MSACDEIKVFLGMAIANIKLKHEERGLRKLRCNMSRLFITKHNNGREQTGENYF